MTTVKSLGWIVGCVILFIGCSSTKEARRPQAESGNGLLMPEGEVLEFFLAETKPRLIKHARPTYPEIARKAGLQGKVFVRLYVGSGGRVAVVQVLEESPSSTRRRSTQ